MPGRRRECKSLLLALLLLGSPAHAQEDEISVVGLSHGKAVVILGNNPRPRVLHDGDSLPNGARLIKATPDSALFEIDGKRRSMTMGNLVSTATPDSGNGQVVLTADERGHFVTIGNINGATVRFLVDTGATLISMGRSDAHRLGINYLNGERGLSNTANGVAPVYKVKLDTVRIGEITLNNVDALVHDQNMPWVLLGMSFLNRVEMQRDGERLTLTKRY